MEHALRITLIALVRRSLLCRELIVLIVVFNFLRKTTCLI
jgi:hypothetical protein